MKKMFVLMTAVVVMALTIASVLPAQNQADIQEMQEITADFQAGKITLPEFQRRIEAIRNRMGTGAYDEPPRPPQQRQQSQPQQGSQIIRKTYTGATAGWPPASAFGRYGFTITQPNLGNPNGISPSYKTEGEKILIYIAKNFSAETTQASILEESMSDTDRNALKRHIALAIGQNQISEGTIIPDPNRKNTQTTHYNIRIDIHFDSLEEDVLAGYSYRTVKWTVIGIEPYAQNISGDGK
jgi:hypothetical protein